jgi:phage baseplate assembly protein W
MANERTLLTDIRLTLRRNELRPVYAVATERKRIPNTTVNFEDMLTITGRDNLAQAIIIRLLTPRGELTPLAHPDYGSRLHELIGRQNTETTRNLAKLFILESLQVEARVAKALEVTVTPTPGTRDFITILLRVQPIGDAESVTIGPFTLELTP